jgi:hypothetical protein
MNAGIIPVMDTPQHAELGLRLYGMMQHLLIAFANEQRPEVPEERGTVQLQDALDAVVQLAAAVDELAQNSVIPAERAKWIASLLMVVREYIQPLPRGLAQEGEEDLVTPDLQEMVDAIREGRRKTGLRG